MIAIPFLDLKAQYDGIKEEVEATVLEVLRSGEYILGPRVEAFEREVADYCGTKYAVAVASGTDALALILDSLGIGPGDEVVTTPFTFFATAESVSRVGAVPVFADIEPSSFNIDANSIEAKITSKTKAIIPVHLFGRPADMDEINALAAERGIAVVEDACQAMGASYKGKKVGSLGKAAAFSFYPTKNLGGVGDGGIITTDDFEIASRAKLLRDHGSTRRYHHREIGYNSRLDAIQAAILSIKLKRLDAWNGERRSKARKYSSLLGPLGLAVPDNGEDRVHVYHLYTVRSSRRDEIAEGLKKAGIGCGIYYPLPLHLQEVYEGLGYRRGSLPEAEKAAEEVLSLPIYPELADAQIEEVAAAVRSVL